MRITFILPGYPWKPVGGFRVVYEYANHLVARGHEVSIVHPRNLSNADPLPPSTLYSRLWRKAIRFRNRMFKPGVSWQPLDKRVRMFYRREPVSEFIPDGDVVFATAWQTCQVVSQCPSSKGRKFYLVQDFYPYLGSRSDIEKTWQLPFKKVIISSWLRDLVVESGVNESEAVVIPIGVDPQRFPILKAIEGRPKRVAMMYSTGNYKASQDGLQALDICRKRMVSFEAILFGPGRKPKTDPPWIEYRKNVKEEDLVKIYNSSSIFLSSSLAEGFALPPAEAMACGCAVAATDSGGIREYAEEGETALLSPPGDPEKLAGNLMRLLEDDHLRMRLAQAGHERIMDFTWQRSADLLERFLSEAVGG